MPNCLIARSTCWSAACASAGDDAREPTYIKTVRSEGYVFSLPVQLLGPDE